MGIAPLSPWDLVLLSTAHTGEDDPVKLSFCNSGLERKHFPSLPTTILPGPSSTFGSPHGTRNHGTRGCAILDPVPLGPCLPSQGVDCAASVTPLGVSMCKSPHDVHDSAGARKGQAGGQGETEISKFKLGPPGGYEGIFVKVGG